MKKFKTASVIVLFMGLLLGASSCAVRIPGESGEPRVGVTITNDRHHYNQARQERYERRQRYERNRDRD